MCGLFASFFSVGGAGEVYNGLHYFFPKLLMSAASTVRDRVSRATASWNCAFVSVRTVYVAPPPDVEYPYSFCADNWGHEVTTHIYQVVQNSDHVVLSAAL